MDSCTGYCVRRVTYRSAATRCRPDEFRYRAWGRLCQHPERRFAFIRGRSRVVQRIPGLVLHRVADSSGNTTHCSPCSGSAQGRRWNRWVRCFATNAPMAPINYGIRHLWIYVPSCDWFSYHKIRRRQRVDHRRRGNRVHIDGICHDFWWPDLCCHFPSSRRAAGTFHRIRSLASARLGCSHRILSADLSGMSRPWTSF